MKKSILITVSILFIAMLGSCDSVEGKGMLKISSEPADAEIYIDGKRKGNTPAKKGQTYAIKLPEGEYSIEIIKPISNPGQYDQHYGQKTVFVADDSLQTVTLSLKKRQSEAHKKQMRKAAAEALPRLLADMVTIPSGSFRMGSNKSSDEKPIHTVLVSSFRMGKHEVTQAQWMAVMGDNPSNFSGMNNPVEQVSWDDIQSFLGKLNQQSGKTFRLPSEAEWEYAARAGTTTAFSTGECINTDQANYDGNSDYNKCGAKTGVYRKKTMPVGSFQPNAFGLYDMHGNVWEWVQDCWNKNYNGAPANGSAWLSGTCKRRVLRGGSWFDNPDYMRSAPHLL